MWRIGFVMLVSLSACSRASRASDPSSDAAVNAGLSANVVTVRNGTVADGSVAVTTESSSWVVAIRNADWLLAEQLIAALPAAEQEEPRLRFAKARVAGNRKDFLTARDNLIGLEADLPELQYEIRQYRAEAELEAGPYQAAALYFVERDDPSSLGRAALAYARGDEPNKAMRVAERALTLASKSDHKSKRNKRLLETEARSIRAQIASAQGRKDIELLDLSWILTHDPLSAAAQSAEASLATKYPRHRLTPPERLARAEIFSRAGDIEATERELEALKVPVNAGAPRFATLLRAWAHYFSRSSYAQAAELLTKCAAGNSAERPKLLFYAARALSRAGQDAVAIQKYSDLARRYPNGGYAEEATYLIGRLHYIAGDWQQADRAYADYLRRFGQVGKRKISRGRFAAQARYEQNVTRLIVGQATTAKEFAALASLQDNPFEKARLVELEAVALIKDQPTEATALFRRVIEQWPLSLPALLAEARLRAMGIEPPLPPDSLAPNPKLDPVLAVKLPAKAELLHGLGFDTEAEAALAQVEDSIRRQYEPRGGEALCELYGTLNSAKRRYSLGRRLVKSAVLLEPPTSSTRWAWECVYPQAHRDIVSEVEKSEVLPRNLIYAVMRQESSFDAKVVSSAGAVGLMQMMPATAKHIAAELGIESDRASLEAPAHNIRLGGRYLRKLSEMFDGQLAIMLAAYNAGPHAASRWLEHGEELPLDLWIARIPYAETRGYVVRVLSNLVRYEALHPAASSTAKVDLEIPIGLRAAGDAY